MSDSNENIPTASQEVASSESEKHEEPRSLSPASSISAISECGSSVSESGKPKSKPGTSKIAKPTGLKLPTAGTTTSTTRIGRPCCNVPKPAIPPNPAKNTSLVLTEDTDGFIIGDRVWVGGTKPGQIAYIGETQFAPGEWAGIVLDEPIGKNDGTVYNVRYFQCEPKRGVFSRLYRLTRYPLLAELDRPSTPKSLNLESRKSNGSITTTVPKKSSLVLTPTSSSKNVISKPSSPDSALHPNIKEGDRVIVMSSQGSKAGILRYLGATDFAPGEWCGVELDDPLGKNDGSVAGTRYFECRPKFGLFAPLHKVSKSPANKRPSQANCQIHRGGGSAGIRRQGSKESLASVSSAASTTASVRSTARKIGVRTPTTPTSTKNALQDDGSYFGYGYY